MSSEPRDPELERQRDADDEAVQVALAAAGRRPPLPPEDLASIEAAVLAAWRTQVGWRADAPRRPAWWLAASLAAALAVALGLAWWWAARPRPGALVATVEALRGDVDVVLDGGVVHRLAAGERLPSGALLRTAAPAAARPGRVALRLARGGGVRLDAGSGLRLVAPAVLALDRGAVYVDSGAGGPAARVEVRTPLAVVRELGTQFAVRVGGVRPDVVVRVREGVVVALRDGERRLARAGEELIVHADGRAELHPAAAWGGGWEWVMEAGPGFAIEGRTLRELLGWVSRETGWRVRLEDGLAGEDATIVLHGDTGTLRADRALFAVLPGAGLTGEVRDGTLVIRPRR
ncbi:MAG TPA: FecR domain-containing protein [Thermoanaerobaculia bacterium]|jgi:hypothetical protein|nr:FecR domain-containing protein [Thermoanaerobaculia bacterium]